MRYTDVDLTKEQLEEELTKEQKLNDDLVALIRELIVKYKIEKVGLKRKIKYLRIKRKR